MTFKETVRNAAGDHGLSEKGLKAGSVGLIGAVVIGISCIAPAYTLTAALGPTAQTSCPVIRQVLVGRPALAAINLSQDMATTLSLIHI